MVLRYLALVLAIACCDHVTFALEKAGCCPPRDPRLICDVPSKDMMLTYCQGDEYCPGDKKCCYVGCIKTCIDPITKDDTPKPGECPADDFLSACDTPVIECSVDSDCPRDSKCCNYNGMMVCKKPRDIIVYIQTLVPVDVCQLGPMMEGTTYVCDAYIPMYTYNRDKMTCDVFIYGGCNGGKNLFETKEECEKTCMKDKPGTCPVQDPAMLCAKPTPEVEATWCKDDSYCPGDQKCCFFGCSRTCISPGDEVQKPGTCPPDPNPIWDPSQYPPKSCTIDYDCPDDYKCCYNNDGSRVCKKPQDLYPKPGTCPVRGPKMLYMCARPTPADMARWCTDDSSCPYNQKCCFVGCSKECTNPVGLEKPGVCPIDGGPIPMGGAKEMRPCSGGPKGGGGVGGCALPPIECTSDYDCSLNWKCCGDFTGRLSCRPPQETSIPKPGTCPNIFYPIVPCPPPTPEMVASWCVDDYSCPGEQKCCDLGCSRACSFPDPPPQKPGICPSVSDIMKCGLPASGCSDDFGCSDNLKCCPSGGGSTTCVKPKTNVNPGECPANYDTDCEYLPDQCTSDEDCGLVDKCCTYKGRKICVPPAPFGTTTPPPTTTSGTNVTTTPGPNDDICYLGPIELGQVNNCSGAFKKYTYDYKTGKCKKFLYGGCHGSKNLFDTLDECKRACVSKCGKCPNPQNLGICTIRCINDWDCQGEDKCCPTSCGGAICLTPEKCCSCGQSSKKSIKLVMKNGKCVTCKKVKKKSKKDNKDYYDSS